MNITDYIDLFFKTLASLVALLLVSCIIYTTIHIVKQQREQEQKQETKVHE